MKVNWNAITVSMVVFTLFLSVVSLGITFTTLQRYEQSLQTIKRYDVQAGLNITYPDGSRTARFLDFDEQPFLIFDEDDKAQGWSYHFINSELNLTANFKFIFLEIYVPEEAYNFFSHIRGNWTIENTLGIISKYSFQKSSWIRSYYVYRINITEFMFKDAVPQEAEAFVKLLT